MTPPEQHVDGGLLSASIGLFAPGAPVYVVLHKDPLRERIDVRSSCVLATEGDVLFLSQTDPPVPELMRGAELEVAALLPGQDTGRRPVGYVARLLDLPRDFRPGPEGTPRTALAVSAPLPGDFFETSLRMHYRVTVDEDMGVVLRLAGTEVLQLLDFSAGGARAVVSLAAPPPPPAEPCSPDPEAEEPDGEAVWGAAPPAEAASGMEPVEQRFALGRSLPFRLVFLGSGFAEGEAVVCSTIAAADGESATLGLSFTNMEIRDIRYLERMVARTVSTCRQRLRDADYF